MAAGWLLGWIPFLRRRPVSSKLGPEALAGLPARVPLERRPLLNESEKAFLQVLRTLLLSHVFVSAKVRLADILRITEATGDFPLANELDQVHVDFLLCDPVTLHVLCAIELEGISKLDAQLPSDQKRQALISYCCAAAKIRLLRFPAKSTYTSLEVAERIRDIIPAVPDRRRPDH